MLGSAYYNVFLCPTIVFARALCPTAALSSFLLQCFFMSYSIAFQCTITVSLYVLQQCLPLTYYSVCLCP